MTFLWRGSLLPLGREAALKTANANFQIYAVAGYSAAAQPSGSTLPRHRYSFHQRVKRYQHSTALTANPPREVSLYLSCISAPVSRMVRITRSSEIKC